eukprot:5824081-Amphidinium_carterae.1
MAALPTMRLAVPAAYERDAGSVASAYSAEDWRTWEAQRHWRDWSWGAAAHTWGGRQKLPLGCPTRGTSYVAR